MLLKDLMEEKQLNLDQPLLSVRRFGSTKAAERKTDNNSSAKAPPHTAYKPELKSGPLRRAGNVPFLWEKAPGKPKDQSKSYTQSVEKPCNIAPNYPPGRTSKGALVADTRCGSDVSNSQRIVASLDKRVTKNESLKEENSKEKVSSSYSDDETFVDALDTLSRAESFFMSSNVNSMSGLDDQEVKLSGNLSLSLSDQQVGEFMINRLLPAAQAKISETHHQYGSFRKPIVGQEKQKQVKEVLNVEKSLPLDQQRPKTLPHCAQDKTDESNGAESYTATGCGLFPRLCLLNQIPGLRMEDKVQCSAVNGMQTQTIASMIGSTKEHARSSFRKKSLDSKTGFAEEKDIMCVTEKSKHGTDPHQRGSSKLLTCECTQHDSSHESPVVEKILYVDSVQKIKSHSGSCSSEMKCKTSKGSCICKNPSNDEASLGNNKHLDVVHEKPTSQHKNLEPLDMKIKITNHSKKTDSEKQGLKKPINQGNDMDRDSVSVSSTKIAGCQKIIDLARQVPSNQNSSSDQIENSEAAKSVDKRCTHGSKHDPSTLATTKVGDDGKIDLESQCLKNLGHQGTSNTSYLHLQLTFPSLKAPSESWLKRTLPTISSKNTLTKPNLASNTSARSQHHKTPSLYTKWETIVKSSNVHHGYQRLHKEFLTTIPEA